MITFQSKAINHVIAIGMMRFAFVALIFVALPSLSQAGTFVAYGPITYTRGTGAPTPVTANFPVLDPSTTYTLRIDNTGVSSAVVTLNGVDVLKPNDFNANVTLITKQITLRLNNQLTVELRGAPGRSFKLQIIGVDNAPPTITGAVAPAPNAAGWNNSNPTVTFTCADTTSGIASCTAPVTVATETPGQAVVGTATDRAGNTATASVTVKLDKTLPTLNITPANGVTATTTTQLIEVMYTDNLSGIDTSSLKVLIDGQDMTSLFAITPTKASYMASLAPGQHTVTVGVKDFAGNMAQGASTFTISSPSGLQSLPDAVPRSGAVPLTVNFITRASYPGGAIIRYRWDFQGDGVFDTNDPGARDYTRTFTQRGVYNAVLEVTNDRNEIATGIVTITVTGASPTATASVNPSNGAVPLAVNFIGSGTDPDGAIVRYEWDFQGDGTFDFTSTTTGSTTFTYTTAGTYNALFRVTDNDGLTATARVTATAVRVGPPGSPTATITSPANPVTGNAPLTINFNGTGSDSDGTITKYEWDFDGDGIYDFTSSTSGAATFRYDSPGTYTAAFRVTDNSGLTGADTVDITVNLPITLTLSTDTCRPMSGGMISVNTTQSGSAPVTIFIRDKSGQTVRTLVNNVSRPAGSYSDSWDCMNTNGQSVQEGVYYAILQYVANGQVIRLDKSTTTGGQLFNPNWTMSTTGGSSCFTCPFKPLEDNFLKLDCSMPRAAEVSVSIRLFNRVDEVTGLFNRKLFGRGNFTLYWDGTDASGNLVHPPPGETFLWGMTGLTLPDNAIFVEAAPQLSDVSANPNYFNPSTGSFLNQQAPTTKIAYTLSKQATVSLQVFRAGTNRQVQAITQTNAPAGSGMIEWDGRNANGVFADKGDYWLLLRAVDAAGNQSIVRFARVRVFH